MFKLHFAETQVFSGFTRGSTCDKMENNAIIG